MEPRTHIDSLSDDLLIKVLRQSMKPHSRKPEISDALWASLDLEATDIRGKREFVKMQYDTPLPTPLATESAPIDFLLASVCRRWRRVAQNHLHPHVSELLLRENLVASLHDLTVAVARFPSLTHLHLCDLGVETLNDAFFAHLASSCSKLAILHVGGEITPRIPGLSDEHPITDAGMDLFFRRCSQLQQLSLYCLRDGADFPPSFFQLKHLHTLALTTPATLENPEFRNLTSLTTLHLAFPAFHLQQLSTLLDLPIAHLSIFDKHRSSDQPAAPFSIALLPYLETLKFTNFTPPFDFMFPQGSPPCARLQQLLLTDYQELEGPPNNIGDLLPSLRKLVIHGCPSFTELPESFPSLTRLEFLVISDAKFLFGLPDDLGDLAALKTLVLKSLPLVTLPSSFSQLTSLNALVLDNCYQLRQLPAGFCHLPALKALYIECLRTFTLPHDIGQLTSLATLRFNGSRRQQPLPASLTALTALTSLQLHECAIPELPDALGELSNLTELSVLCCPISRLPESITRLIRLERLAVVLCPQLAWVPRRLDSLERLKQLQLTYCEGLSHPPAVLPRSLELLSVLWSGKQPTALADVSGLSQLRELELHVGGGGQGPGAASCPASDLQVGESLSSLSSLGAAGHCWSRGLSRLHRLALHLDNAAVELPFPLTFLPSLRRLTISGHGIRRLPESIGAAFPQLRQLKLEQVSSLEEVPGSIGELQQLTALEIHAPMLASLPHTIGALSRLRTLDLSECRNLQQLPASLTRLACLHDLDASSTSISALPAGFAHLTRLRSLSLKYCRELHGFPEDFTQLTALRYLLLSGCRDDCRDMDWLRAHGLAKLRWLLVML